MSVLLINLRHAPDDEIVDIKDQLDKHNVEYYMTKAGAWGVSAPNIWIKDQSDLDRAKVILEEYQEQRFHEQRAEYEYLKQTGQHRTFLQNLREQPISMIFYGLFVVMILYFSIRPFFLVS